MGQFVKYFNNITVTSTWTVTGTLTGLGYTYMYGTPSTGGYALSIDVSDIPAGAIINSVNFSYSALHKGSYSQNHSTFIKDGGSTYATNENLKKWLEEHKNGESFSNFGIWFQTKAVYGQKESNNFNGSKTYSVSTVFTSISLIIDYTDPIDSSLNGPTISNFSVIDSWNNLIKFEGTNLEGGIDSLKTYSLDDLTVNSNSFLQNYSNFIFSCVGESKQTSIPTLKYNLTIKRKSNSKTLFENKNILEGKFVVPYTIFSEEIDAEFIDGYDVIECIFSLQVVDAAEKITEITDSFWLVINYYPPVIKTFETKRVDYVLNEEGTEYVLAESTNGELISTNLSIVSLTPIPKIIDKENDNTEVINLICEKSWTNLSDETDKSEAITFTVTNYKDDISFFCGENISESGTKPSYSIIFSSAEAYQFKITIRAEDAIFIQAISEVQEATGYFSIELGGVAIGERHPGTTEADSNNPTFLVNLPTTFKKQIILIEGFSYGEAEPSTIFTGANEETNPSPQEGQIYFRLL